MQTRPALSALVFALVGCSIGDNDAPMSGGGEGGGTDAVEPMDENDASEGGSDEGPAYPGDGNASGGEGGGDDDDDAESGGEYDDGCGDTIVGSYEQCDDGNENDGDGCQADCTITQGVRTFDLGGAHTCAIDYFGDVRCWGDNSYGQLGYASLGIENIGANVTPKAFMRTVSIGAVASQIELGLHHTCARTADGEVFCWGSNKYGQLGYGHTEDLGDEPGEAPSDVGPIALPAPAISIGAGRAHTCALLETGELRCWGEGGHGQLGIGDGFAGGAGSGAQPFPFAADAPAIEMFGVSAHGLQIGIGDFGCVSDDDSRLHCWGANEAGQLGLGHADDIGIDVEAMKDAVVLDEGVLRFTAGEAHACVLNDSFGVQCFGRNADGQLGYSRTDNIGDDEEPIDGIIHLDGHLAVGVAAGADFSCARLDDATVRCWGDGSLGQLGTGVAEKIGDDENPADAFMFGPVPLLSFATDLAAGAEHVCARTADAALRCWGNGADGRLGYGGEGNVGDSPASLPVMPVPIF